MGHSRTFLLRGAGTGVTTSATGTTNTIPKFTSASAIADSQIHDDGSTVYVGTNARALAVPGFGVSGAVPGIYWDETDGAANGKIWNATVNTGALVFGCINDAVSTTVAWFTITRSGQSPVQMFLNTDQSDCDIILRSVSNSNSFVSDAGLHGGLGGFGFGAAAASGTHLTVTPPSGATTAINCTSGDVKVSGLGAGLFIKEGTNATMGVVTLSGAAGSAIVYTTKLTAASRIFITEQNSGGTPGVVRVTSSTNLVSFTITSSSITDTSVVAWFLIQQA